MNIHRLPDIFSLSSNDPGSQLSVLERLCDDGDDVFSRRVDDLTSQLTTSVRKRVTALPKFCKNCVRQKLVCSHAKIGVLFSGKLFIQSQTANPENRQIVSMSLIIFPSSSQSAFLLIGLTFVTTICALKKSITLPGLNT